MKHLISILSVLIISSISLTACSSSNEDEPYAPPLTPSNNSRVLNASISQGIETKTALNSSNSTGAYPVLWSENDQIGVFFDGSQNSTQFRILSGAGTSNAQFEGTNSGSTHIGFYPYQSIINAIDASNINVIIPTVQPYKDGTFASNICPMLSGRSYDDKLMFKNICSIVCIKVTGSCSISSITLRSASNDIKLSGKAELNLESGQLSMTSEAADYISMDLNSQNYTAVNDQPIHFFFVVPSQSYTGGFIIEMTCDGEQMIVPIENDFNLKKSELSTFEIHIDNKEIIPDQIFRNYLLAYYDKDGNRKITSEDLNDITELDLTKANINVTSLQGLEYFSSLKSLKIFNSKVKSLDLSSNTNLETLYISSLDLTSLSLPDPSSLKSLELSGTSLTDLDLSSATNLETLRLHFNTFNTELTSLSLPDPSSLKSLELSGTLLTDLDLSSATNLETLRLSGNDELASLNLPDPSSLKSLQIYDMPLTAIDLSSATNLETLTLSGNDELASLNLPDPSSLKSLELSKTLLTDLDLSSATNLESILVESSKLESISLCNSAKLQSVSVNSNESLISVEANNLADIKQFYITNNKSLTTLNLTNCKSLSKLTASGNSLQTLDLQDCPALKDLNCDNNQLASIDVSDLRNLTNLSCNSNRLTEMEIKDKPNLTGVSCNNNNISSLDVSGNPNLIVLSCDNNGLREINLNDDGMLSLIHIEGHTMGSLYLSECHQNIKKLYNNSDYSLLVQLRIGQEIEEIQNPSRVGIYYKGDGQTSPFTQGENTAIEGSPINSDEETHNSMLESIEEGEPIVQHTN